MTQIMRDIVQLYTMVPQIKYAYKINNTKLNIIQIQYIKVLPFVDIHGKWHNNMNNNVFTYFSVCLILL